MKTYRGYRAGGGCAVEVRCEPIAARGLKRRAVCGADEIDAGTMYFLPARHDLLYLSIYFNWGTQASKHSVEQLALALMADALGEEVAICAHEQFAASVVARLEDAWELSDDDLLAWHRDWQEKCRD